MAAFLPSVRVLLSIVAVAVGCVLFPSVFISTDHHDNLPLPPSATRRLGMTLESFNDPKTVLLRPSLNEGVQSDADADGGIVAGAESSSNRCPRGILFLFHGCTRHTASFFYSPQGRRLVELAKRAGLEVVAFEKKEEEGCWQWKDDGEAIRERGRKLTESLQFECGGDVDAELPPMWAFGASSGGSFIAELAVQMKEDPSSYSPFLFSAINVQISSPAKSLDWDIPTIFTVMDGDADMKASVRARIDKKQQQQAGNGPPFKMMVTSGQKGIHADHFHEVFRDAPQMTPAVSNEIYQDLVTKGIVDASNDDRLVADPRTSAAAVASISGKYTHDSKSNGVLPFGISHEMVRPLSAAEIDDANGIWLVEELNVAWDRHEITAEGFEDVLAFFFQFGMGQ